MFLDFSTIPEISVPHFKGGQGQALVRKFEDEQGKILILTLPAGSTIGHHVHEGSFEVMHFLSGEGVCIDDGTSVTVRPGMTHYCAPGPSHSVVNTGAEPLVILGVVPNVK